MYIQRLSFSRGELKEISGLIISIISDARSQQDDTIMTPEIISLCR